MLINLHNDEYISNYIREHGCWEPFTVEVLLELFRFRKPFTTFVDVGANIGYFSLIAAEQGIPVVAFEPVAANFGLFTKSIEQNNFSNLIKVYMIPLSDTREKIVLNISNENMGLCSTRQLLNHSYTQSSMSECLDTYFGKNIQNDIIIKIDVEEQELKVLKGMTETLSSGHVTHIIIEISVYNDEIFDILRKYGYIYCVNIGFDDKTKTSINYNSNYLSNARYQLSLDQIQYKTRQDCQKPGNFQKMLMFYQHPLK